MSSVDDRIVNMQFNNRQFTQGVTESQRSLEGLESTLAKTASGKGLTSMAASVEQVSSRFSSLQVAGVAAIATIASKATTLGLNLVKSLTIDPISAGFAEYETNLNSVQIIMANTGEKTKTVSKYLNDLNHYSDQTIYNFSQMADSIGKFTSAGVKLPEATSAIKGMANAAALSGANSQQLNNAMYQMSQAMASGTIKLMDWNSLVNSNMGGKNIQAALMSTAESIDGAGEAMRKATDNGAVPFRESLAEGWLTSDVFAKSMKVMAGTTLTAGDLTGKTAEELKKLGYEGKKAGDTVAFTVEQLKGMGYADKAAQDLHKLSGSAIESATKIKTFTQMIDVIKESVGSGFAKIFENLFGNIKQAGSLWTTVGGKITTFIGNMFNEVNVMLGWWKKLGGYTALWNGFGNIFKAIGNLLQPFKEAWEAIFPDSGKAKALTGVSKGFEDVTGWIEKFTRGADLLTPVLVVVGKAIQIFFGMLSAGFQVVKPFFGSILDFQKSLKSLSAENINLDSIVTFAGDFGERAKAVAGDIVAGLIQGLREVSIGDIKNAVIDIADSVIESFKSALGIASPAKEMVPIGEAIVLGLVEGMKAAGIAILDTIKAMGKWIVEGWKQMFGDMDSLDVAALINSIFSGALLLAITSVVKDGGSLKNSLLSVLSSIKDGIAGLTKAMGDRAKAELIKSYAIAIGVLAVSLLVLSFIPAEKLAVGMAALAGMLTLLTGALFALSKINGEFDMVLLAGSLLLISFALINIAAAVTIFGQQDPIKVAQGLAAMAITLGILILAVLAFSKIKGSIEGFAASLLVMSIALNLLAAAVLAFGSMSLETLAKGLGSMAVAMTIMMLSLKVFSKTTKGTEKAGAAILLMAIAMNLMASATLAFGNMDTGTIAKGMIAMGVALAIMVGALLLISAVAGEAVVSAGAMITMAIAINLLVTAIVALGNMDAGTIAKGIGAIAAALAVLLLAGAAAYFVAPGLLILAAAVAALGAAMLMAGLGMLAFGAGFALMAAAGVAGVAILIVAFQAFMALLPQFAMQIAASFVVFLETIAKAAPRIREALGKIIANMLGVVTDAIPKMGKVVSKLLDTIFKVLTKAVPQVGKLFRALINEGLTTIEEMIPRFVKFGTRVVIGFLDGMTDAIPKIADKAVKLITTFINEIADQGPKLADSALKAIIKFINGISDAIDDNAEDLRTAGLNLARAIIDGLTGGLFSEGLTAVKDAAYALADSLPGWMKKVLHISSPSKVMIEIGEYVVAGYVKGIEGSAESAVKASVALANAIVSAGNEEIAKLQDTASKDQSLAYTIQGKADVQNLYAKQLEAKAKAAERAEAKSQREAEKAKAEADKLDSKADKIKKENAEQAKKLHALADKQEKVADKLKEAAKEQQKATKAADKVADKQLKAANEMQKAADKAQGKADASAKRVQDNKAFEAASLMEKGQILQNQGDTQTADAQKHLATATAQQAKASKLLHDDIKTNNDRGKELKASAKENRQYAKDAAAAAQASYAAAENYFTQAHEAEGKLIDARIDKILGTVREDKQAAEDEAKYQAADQAGKIAILQSRAEASEALAKQSEKEANDLVDFARAQSRINADAANAALDEAEAKFQTAKDAAERAKDERQRAADLANQAASGDSAGGVNGSITIARNALDEAAKAVDRYSQSLADAESLSAARSNVVQFVQHNTSPASLTASEIYRQTKNLLSVKELKMGAV